MTSSEDIPQPVSENSVLVPSADQIKWSKLESTSVRMRAGVAHNFKEAESNLLTMLRINVESPVTALTVGLSIAGLAVCSCFVCSLLLLDHVLHRQSVRTGAKIHPPLAASPHQQSPLKRPRKSSPPHVLQTASLGGSPRLGTPPLDTAPFEVGSIDAQGMLMEVDSDGLLAAHQNGRLVASPPPGKSPQQKSRTFPTCDAGVSSTYSSPMLMAQPPLPSTLTSHPERAPRLHLPVGASPSFGPHPDDDFLPTLS